MCILDRSMVYSLQEQQVQRQISLENYDLMPNECNWYGKKGKRPCVYVWTYQMQDIYWPLYGHKRLIKCGVKTRISTYEIQNVSDQLSIAVDLNIVC